MTPDELSWRAQAPRPAPRARPRGRWAAALVAAAALGWAVTGAGVRPGALIEGRSGGLRLLRAFAHPDLTPGFLHLVGGAVAETVQISLTGLLFAVVLAVPAAVPLAGNVGVPSLVRSAARMYAAVLRGVPDLMWALLFVATIGPGPAAGALAIGVHGGGLLAKLGAEQLEAVDPAPVEAIRLTGAGRFTTAALAIVPQAAAGLTSLLLYQWECNIRTSTVLGFVGAGGVGQELAISLKLFRYAELSTLVIAVLLLMLAVDVLSRAARRWAGAAA
ncbi:phosphonate ABC transporter, permease protein PhnE [Actinomadura sp. NEAU-AAG7]|uniref:phosphonate ABC transporter, permease protein PhnE n=1 Tax=Actinomadura sp. NEAU-AAG7 TaxID=2839640 RepID=UPI001BE48E2B|nr:phosphonate ABC transporter, permease protein PhnE [Actinomadura sp. NEAU-AAG7]MBT2212736.1 phosphonate ABC transporter, permease protein PhnE [Actinomadura sp. NEAU-AAG7]